MYYSFEKYEVSDNILKEENFRKLKLSTMSYYNIEAFANDNAKDLYDCIATFMVYYQYDLSDESETNSDLFTKEIFERTKEHIEKDSMPYYNKLVLAYKEILEDEDYFPVVDIINSDAYVYYSDSFGGERTYGGERTHEGCDIMSSNNKRGYFPIISVCDGTVESIGWLELGGYRIGVRSENGAYFYYAHLFGYADGISQGDKVKAGQMIGYMGDTGYSLVEGTTGNFDVHLHFGIYINDNNEEISINPYWILKLYEDKKLQYSFIL